VIVLDTHVWLWWVSDPKLLSDRARTTIEAAATIGVSAISCWEVAMLVLRGRIALDRELDLWIQQALALERIDCIPVDSRVAVAAAQLVESGFPADPADRMVYATAKGRGAPLVTKDAAIRGFDPQLTVW
jgi:PIN domain nuclease of toxin-antitoxin system